MSRGHDFGEGDIFKGISPLPIRINNPAKYYIPSDDTEPNIKEIPFKDSIRAFKAIKKSYDHLLKKEVGKAREVLKQAMEKE